MYSIHKSMRGALLPRPLCHQNVGRAEIILHSRHCVVLRNVPGYLGTKVVEDGPAWRVFDDELDQLHRRIGQASGGFHEEDGKVIRVRGEIPEDGPIPSDLVCGPDLLDPEDASSWEDRVAVRIEQRLGEVDRGGGVANGHVYINYIYRRLVEVMKPQSTRVDPEFRAKARLVRKSEKDCLGPIWRVVLWPRPSSQSSQAGVSTRGSLGRTERMDVWVEETALSRSMVVSRTAW